VSDAAQRGAWKFDGTLNVGTLLGVGIALISTTGWFFATRNTADSAQQKIANLEISMKEQAVNTRDSIRESMARMEGNLGAIGAQVAQLGPLTERLRRVEADIARLQEADSDLGTRIENRRNLVDARHITLEARVAEALVRLENLSRASGVDLPGRPGVRR
jgi:hypothetical protein